MTVGPNNQPNNKRPLEDWEQKDQNLGDLLFRGADAAMGAGVGCAICSLFESGSGLVMLGIGFLFAALSLLLSMTLNYFFEDL